MLVCMATWAPRGRGHRSWRLRIHGGSSRSCDSKHCALPELAPGQPNSKQPRRASVRGLRHCCAGVRHKCRTSRQKGGVERRSRAAMAGHCILLWSSAARNTAAQTSATTRRYRTLTSNRRLMSSAQPRCCAVHTWQAARAHKQVNTALCCPDGLLAAASGNHKQV